MEASEGFLFDLYRGTTHDGPGMRSTAFFKGCPLHCAWCHNPESISTKQQIWWEQAQCIGCLQCVSSCPHDACQATEQGIYINEHACVQCGNCIKTCPTGALSFIGKYRSTVDLMKELEKYAPYYKKYGGGITVSGGEPLLQYPFVETLFRMASEKGIHTALDTCGAVSYKCFEHVLPFTNCVLFDIKLMDSQLHKQYTGSDNKEILANLLHIAEDIRAGRFHCDIWIRTPLIPGITATETNMISISEFILNNLSDVVSRWELCTFNKACSSKYSRLHQTWTCADTPLVTHSDVAKIRSVLSNYGFPSDKLVISGMIVDDLG